MLQTSRPMTSIDLEGTPMENIIPTADTLRNILRYDETSGLLFWKSRSPELFKSKRDCDAWNSRYSGKKALNSVNDKGYRIGDISSKKYSSHRVIWAIYYGDWPVGSVDHIDGDRSNNRISNLRVATPSQNSRNKKPASGSSSMFTGVSWNKANGKWQASIRADVRQKHIGYFDCEITAAKAYDNEAVKHFGEFAKPNFKG